ncbi:MAG: ADP-heptose:LPS heptosyltransferase [Flavobacterium sp.]|jgi:ADP-heptose:LPS heptosyltransferase
MGDVAMTVPILRAFSEQYPDVKITMVSRKLYLPFFKGIPNLSFFEMEEKDSHNGFLGLLQMFADLKKLKIDAVADLHNVIRSKLIRILFALGGKSVAHTDKGRKEKALLTKEEDKVFVNLKSMFEQHLETFKKLGFPIDLSKYHVPQKQSLSESALKVVNKKGTYNWIGIAPFAQYESKIYPLDLMQIVINDLAKLENTKIFLFGGGSKEIELLDELKAQKENTIVIAGKLSLAQEMEVISNLDVMLSMDSGNAHIAAMLGIKTITLWGATHPYAGFSPFNQPLENALVSDSKQYPKLPTSVYGNKIVLGYEDVMRTILPEEVVEKVKQNL